MGNTHRRGYRSCAHATGVAVQDFANRPVDVADMGRLWALDDDRIDEPRQLVGGV
jgi:hypothetical protein